VNSLPRASSSVWLKATYKATPQDFYVEEQMTMEFSGEGEHLYLFIEKTGQNTEFIAKQLAHYFGVKPMDVSYSGMKDRWAVTRQWFSVYVRNRQFDSIDLSGIEGVRLVELARHNKKLRRGEHVGNYFRLVVRGVSQTADLLSGLEYIREHGFPNYFGVQRFGRDNQNLERAKRWFAGEIKVSRSQRSFYLSAVRSYLFNIMLADKVQDGTWLVASDGPLYGDDAPELAPKTDEENAFFAQYPELVRGLHKNRMTLARRPYRMPAENFSWSFDDDALTLHFNLMPGAFATSLLSELFDLEDASIRQMAEQ